MDTPLIAILRDHLNKKKTAPFSTDWEALLSLSKKHEVTAVVYSQCRDFIPPAHIGDFERAYSAVLYYHANRAIMAERIEAALADMEHFTIKGSSVARYYPSPAFRTMGDTDIVIHTADREEADRRLRSLGLECASCFPNREWQYYYHDMEFELHDHLVYSESVNIDAQEQYFNDFWKHVKGNELDWSFHFLFLILHLRKHFMNSGVGFRQFMDIAVLCSRGPAFNWPWIESELKKLGLWVFTERVFALNAYWFGTVPPLVTEPASQEFLSSATELILKNGIFGFSNEENRGNRAVNAIRDAGYSRKAMVKAAAQKLFPDCETLKSVPHYAYLRGRAYLLPAAWIHRAFRSVAGRRVRKNMRAVVDSSFADKETIRRREAIYKQWGL